MIKKVLDRSMRLITQSGSLVPGYGKSIEFSDKQLGNIFFWDQKCHKIRSALFWAVSITIKLSSIAISFCECLIFSVLEFWKVLSTNLPLCHKNPRTSQPAWQIGSIRIAVQASEKHYDIYYGRICLFLSKIHKLEIF